MSDPGFGDFKIAVGFEADQVIVGVRGDVGPLTAPTVGAVLGSLIENGHSDMVLDVTAVDSLGTPGLALIRELADRLSKSGELLTVRAASVHAREILDASGVGELVRVEEADPNVAGLGPEQRDGDHSLAVDGSAADVSGLARVGSMSSNDVIDAALRLVTALADATVDKADGVSVTLERYGQMTTVAASNDTVLRMDGHQYETGEGPCLAAAAEGRWFHSESLADETRWPSFAPLAFEQGINSILSSPLMSTDRPLGALNIYSNTERAFGTHEQELAALFATQASGILTAAGADGTEERLNTRFTEALAARQTIAQAQGVLMAREHITSENAAAALHRSARTAGVTVLRYAGQIVISTTNYADPAT